MSKASNKTCVITGATSGIGRAMALLMSERGIKIFFIGRDRARAARMLRAIRKSTQNDTAVFLPCELSDLDQIESTAAAIKTAAPAGIDLLVNNAHVRPAVLQTNKRNIELTFAVNHLSHFALTGFLLESLLAAPAARILNVAGDAYKLGDPQWKNAVRPTTFARGEALATSKLANVVFALELARRLKNTTVTVNAAHPGIVATRAGTNGHPLRLLKYYCYYLMRGELISARTAAMPLVDICLSEKYLGVSGAYFNAGQITEVSTAARNPEVAASLWRLSIDLAQMGEGLGFAWQYYGN